MDGLNPIPRWFAAALIPMMLLVVIVSLTLDPKTSSVRAQDVKKEAPKDKDAPKETPKTIAIDLTKIVVIKQKGDDTLILPPKGLSYEGVPSLYTKEKPKIEDGSDGWILIRKNKACVIQESGTKMSLQLGGVKVKYVFIGLPEGYYATYK